MNVSAPFITRPIATSLLGVAVMCGGLLGYLWLPVSALPQVDFPTIQVTTQLPGASPDTMVALVTAPLERQFGQIPSLATMTSSSSYGISQVTLQFDLNRDIDAAAQDVQAAINAAGRALPRNLPYPPIYSKVNPADTPIVTLALTSQTVSLRNLSDLADTLLAQRLSEITGVGNVSTQGGIKPAVRIQVDLPRLAAYGLALEDIRQAIVNANVAGPKGAFDGASQSYTIAANDQLAAAEAYRTLVIAYRNSAPVMLRDVAEVVDGLENAKVSRLAQRRAGRDHRHPPPARRERRADGPEHPGRAAAAAPHPARRRQAHRGARPHRHDPRLDPRRAVHAGARGRARGAGGVHLPAHHPGDHHRGRRAAALADRDVPA